jgi:hypothetical protein
MQVQAKRRTCGIGRSGSLTRHRNGLCPCATARVAFPNVPVEPATSRARGTTKRFRPIRSGISGRTSEVAQEFSRAMDQIYLPASQ